MNLYAFSYGISNKCLLVFFHLVKIYIWCKLADHSKMFLLQVQVNKRDHYIGLALVYASRRMGSLSFLAILLTQLSRVGVSTIHSSTALIFVLPLDDCYVIYMQWVCVVHMDVFKNRCV